MGQGDVDQEALPGEKVRYLLFSERFKLMDSLLAPFQTFKARATSLWGRVLFLCVHCLGPFVFNYQNYFGVAALTVYALVYIPKNQNNQT